MITTFKRNLMAAALGGVLGLCVTGCQTFNKPAPDTLTSVLITNKSMTDINQAVAGVFASHGFDGGQTAPGQFTYTRLGTRANNLAYGSYMFDEAVTIRIVVTLRQLNPTSTVVACNAWLVEAADDPVFADSHQVRQLRKWPYEQLLKDIQTQLGE
ncbi:MAG: hypothetical protein ACLP2Y_18260 [Limisphaerales bacterium]